MQPRVVVTHNSVDICPDSLQPKVVLTDIKSKEKDNYPKAVGESGVKISQPKVVLTDIKKFVKANNKRDKYDSFENNISKTEKSDFLCKMTKYRRLDSCTVNLEDICENGMKSRDNPRKRKRTTCVGQTVDSSLEYIKPVKLENWGNGEFYGFTAIPKDVYEHYVGLESSAPSNIEKYLLKDS